MNEITLTLNTLIIVYRYETGNVSIFDKELNRASIYTIGTLPGEDVLADTEALLNLIRQNRDNFTNGNLYYIRDTALLNAAVG